MCESTGAAVLDPGTMWSEARLWRSPKIRAAQHGNRAAAREFNINESMEVEQKWRKTEEDLHRVQETKEGFLREHNTWCAL